MMLRLDLPSDQSDNIRGTHRADTFIDKFSVRMECTLPVEMPTDAAMKQTDNCRSLITNLTFSTVSKSTQVAGRPQRGKSSHDNSPRSNSACHFTTVERAGADTANVSFIS